MPKVVLKVSSMLLQNRIPRS